MQVADILARPPRVLSAEQRACYFEHGYLLLERFVSEDWLARLRQVTGEFVEASRSLSRSNGSFDLEPDHSAEEPRLRRLMSPVGQHDVYRKFGLAGPLIDVAEDLLGPDVKYHHSKLNFKWADGGEEVKWHQDYPFWPHTNYAPLTIGVYLSDVDDEMGPMGVVPGSHRGPLFDHYDPAGNWAGSIREDELHRVATGSALYLKGPAGSVTVHNCRMVHGSVPNRSARSRNLLLHTYSPADAMVLTNLVQNMPHSDRIVRGQPAGEIEIEARAVRMPPDWSGGYTSIFALQQAEDRSAA